MIRRGMGRCVFEDPRLSDGGGMDGGGRMGVINTVIASEIDTKGMKQ